MNSTDLAKTNRRQDSKIIPLRGTKSKLKEPISKIPKGVLDGALQENILTLLAFDDEAIPQIIASGLRADHFGSDVYFKFADECLRYFAKYKKAPKDHLPDLVEDCLTSKRRSKAKLYTDILLDINDLAKAVNPDFVLDQLGQFIEGQELRFSITQAAQALQRGDVRSTQELLREGIERSDHASREAGPLPGILTGPELGRASFPTVRDTVYPILQDPGILLGLGPFGSGKTLLFMGLANAISSGENFLGLMIDEPRSVLYIDLELAGNVLQQRDSLIAPYGKHRKRGNISYWSAANCYPAPKPNFADLAQLAGLLEACDPYDVVFVDPISAGTSGVDLNTAEAWEGPLQFAMRRRHAGKSTVIVQHVGKDKSRGPRGSSRQEDFVDTSLMLEKVAGRHGNSAVKMTCRKLRNHPESEFTPIEIEFVSDGDKLRFEYKTLRDSKSQLVAQEYRRMLEDDLIKKGTQAALCNRFNLDKSTVSRIASRVSREFHKERK